jgi:hypothetical protein
MGAYHDVISLLAPDIVVEQLKEREKAKAYFQELVRGRHEKESERLAEYLASPIVHPRRTDSIS